MFVLPSPIVFQKHLTCLVPQAHRRGKTLPRVNHAWHLTHIRFRYSEETLNFRVDAGVSSDFGDYGTERVHFACEEDMNLGTGTECHTLHCVPPKDVC